MGRLAALLLVAAALLAIAAAPGAPAGRPVWAVDPEDPGEDLPPAGRPLFDTLAGAEVPFPFAALVRKVAAALGPPRPGEPAPLERVLIPLGRSLQRNAAAPRFFHAPRAVAAVVGDPGRPDGLFLKDRLYLGYQETAGLLEVISYNEEAGRFEFQVVRDYRPGGRPRVLYASRALCTACHQNAAPIFARQLWDETNANPGVVRLLRAEKRDFYGFPVDLGPDAPYAVQAAADRANRFALDQRLWREGCGGSGARAVRCRAALLTAALQYRLSGGRFEAGLLSPFTTSVRERFPQGFAVPDPDLPNRDPFAGSAGAPEQVSVPGSLTPEQTALLGGVVLQSAVPAALEPLRPRPPLETWTPDGPGLERLVSGLAAFLSENDVRWIDGRLLALGSAPGAPRRHEAAECRLAARRAGGEIDRLKLDCQGSLTLRGRLFLRQGRVTGGEIETASLDGAPALADLAVQGGEVEQAGGGSTVRVDLLQKGSGRRARLPEGGAVERLAVSWRDTGGDTLEGRAEIVLPDDFSFVRKAVEMLARGTLAGESDALGDRPFRRSALMPALSSGLGEPSSASREVQPLPPPSLDAPAGGGEDAEAERLAARFPEPALKAFVHYCSTCHATAQPSPPNFLHGAPDEVRARVGHCAERIWFRLEMWRLPHDDRPKTAMPPVRALRRLHLDPDRWPADPDLELLRRYAAALLYAETGAAPRREEMAARGYESLRECLAEGNGAFRPAGGRPSGEEPRRDGPP